MKTYSIVKDLKTIRKYYALSQEEFALQTGLSRSNIARYELGKVIPSNNSLEKIYSYPYIKNLHLNEIKSMMMKDDRKERILLFHGAKYELKNIEPNHLVGLKDFGSGFYLADSYDAASTWVSEYNEGSVYAFYLKDREKLKTMEFGVCIEWMYAILYYRGALTKYELSDKVKQLINQIENSDIIIAPIADNAMYDIIKQFEQSMISDVQCLNALSATNLGLQYVLKSQKSVDSLTFIEHLYLCEKEKTDLINQKREKSNVGRDKAKLAIQQHVREGKYCHELFKELR